MSRRSHRLDDCHAVVDDLEGKVRVRPSPEAVARLWDSHHGWEACVERWGWIGRWSLEHLAMQGRQLLRARAGDTSARGKRRRTTPEQDAAAFDAIQRMGVCRAAKATGLSIAVIYRVLRERGVEQSPVLPAGERSRATREGMARARAARAAA
jgi:hypothetical protein